MQTINNRMTETQVADLFSLAVQLQVKAEESDDRDTAILAYSIQNACSNLTESRREFWAADATINNLELKITDMAVQLANAESKCRDLAAVVAENAALKNPDNWLSQSDYGYEASEVATQNGATKDKALRAGILAIINRIEAPATDAFLAEVRAQAIESLLTESFRSDIAGALADFDGMDDQSLQTLIWSGQPPEPDGDVWCVEYMSRAAAVLRKVREFAAQLRQGAAL